MERSAACLSSVLPCPNTVAIRLLGSRVVTLSGKDFYLGPWGTKVSKLEYDRVVGEWIQNGRHLPGSNEGCDFAVIEICTAFRKHADVYYTKNGMRTREAEIIQDILVRFVVPLYGRTPVSDFGPLALKAVREKMIEAGHKRGVINKNIDRIRRMFRWAASEEMVPGEIPQVLATVSGLRKGRTTVPESVPVQPVPDNIVDKTLLHLPPIVADMVRFQRLTGCRPGEVCNLRPIDVNRSGNVWAYRLACHKAEHHGRERTVFIGPKAQSVLKPYLLRDPAAFCFSPAETSRIMRETRSAARKTPLSYGNRPGSNRKSEPKRKSRTRYTKDTLNRAVQRACEVAFEMPEELRLASRKLSPSQVRHLLEEGGEVAARKAEQERQRTLKLAAAWRAKHCWSPNQLRHAAGTEVRRQFGLEAAQVVLGHAKADVTQVYAERDQALAAEVMGKIG